MKTHPTNSGGVQRLIPNPDSSDPLIPTKTKLNFKICKSAEWAIYIKGCYLRDLKCIRDVSKRIGRGQGGKGLNNTHAPSNIGVHSIQPQPRQSRGELRPLQYVVSFLKCNLIFHESDLHDPEYTS